MRLNFPIIKEELKHHHTKCCISRPADNFTFQHPVVYNGQKSWREDLLYVAAASSLPPAPEFNCHPSILCAGTPAEPYRSGGCDCLILTESVDTAELLNEVLGIFQKYQDWEDSLNDVIFQNLPLRELGKRSAAFFRNPFLLHDVTFKIIFQIFPDQVQISPERREAYLQIYAAAGDSYVPMDEINAVMSDPLFTQHSEETSPYLFREHEYEFRSLIQNIFCKDKTIAWLICDEAAQPFTDYDAAVLSLLAVFVRRGIREKDASDLNRPKDFDAILGSLLSHRLVPEGKIESLLLNYRWNISDSYLCMAIDSKFDTSEKATLRAFAQQLTLPHASFFYTFYRDRLILILNITKSLTDRETFLKLTLPHLRDNLVSAGISDIFTDFKNLYYYYLQALNACRLGQKKHPEHWYFRWEDYLDSYYISKCQENTIPEALYPAGLQRLIRHDAEKGSNYVSLLRSYLENDRNIAVTSRILYLHRNTFIYRLERIGEILQMDLEVPRNRLILLIALEILQNQAPA